jgi:hypothetical protein
MDEVGLSRTQVKKQKREKSEVAKREASVTRGHSRPRDPSAVGLHTEDAVKAAMKKERLGRMGWHGAAGEGDNRKSVHLVKWMNTGKKVRVFVSVKWAMNTNLESRLTLSSSPTAKWNSQQALRPFSFVLKDIIARGARLLPTSRLSHSCR